MRRRLLALEERKGSKHVCSVLLVAMHALGLGLGETWREETRPTVLGVAFVVAHVVFVVLVDVGGRMGSRGRWMLRLALCSGRRFADRQITCAGRPSGTSNGDAGVWTGNRPGAVGLGRRMAGGTSTPTLDLTLSRRLGREVRRACGRHAAERWARRTRHTRRPPAALTTSGPCRRRAVRRPALARRGLVLVFCRGWNRQLTARANLAPLKSHVIECTRLTQNFRRGLVLGRSLRRFRA